MVTSRLAHHLPSLFGPSRRAVWRLSALRRALAAIVLLLALHLALGATNADPPDTPGPPESSGAALSLPLAAPADHLSPGDEVRVYLPGRTEPLAPRARVLGAVDGTTGAPVVRIMLREKDIGPILRQMGPEGSGSSGFVIVKAG